MISAGSLLLILLLVFRPQIFLFLLICGALGWMMMMALAFLIP
jgi:hypothetical protein